MQKKSNEEQSLAEEEQASRVGPGAWEIPIPDGAQFGGLPPASYLSRCTEEPKESLSSEQKSQTEFTFVIEDPEHPEYNGREAHFWVSREPKAWWSMTQTLDSMSVPYDIVKDSNGKPVTFRFDPMDCVGKMCRTVWVESTWQGVTRSRINRIVSPEERIESLEENLDELSGEDEVPF